MRGQAGNSPQEGKIKERPILFSGEMVRAILDGRKTQTRRVVKTQPPGPEYQMTTLMASTAKDERKRTGMHSWAVVEGNSIIRDYGDYFRCPYGYPGDRLWVRETFCDNGGSEYEYKATSHSQAGVWSPSIHMPRQASRITLEVVRVRTQRLQEITEEDAQAEGVESGQCATLPGENSRTAICIHCHKRGNEHVGVSRVCFGRSSCFNPRTYKGGFARLWDQINGKKAPWESNPYVWVIEFKPTTTAA